MNLAHRLATIALVAKELAGELPKDGPIGEDIKLLGEQVKRCRDILAKLKSLSSGDAPFDTMPLAQLIEEVVQPHRFFDIQINVSLPRSARANRFFSAIRAFSMAWGNIVENAVDFARSEVNVTARWTETEVTVTVIDDGPGLAADVIDRMGEPYLTHQRVRGRRRPGMSDQPGEEPTGLGLGVFIAKRSSNAPAPALPGATVRPRKPAPSSRSSGRNRPLTGSAKRGPLPRLIRPPRLEQLAGQLK